MYISAELLFISLRWVKTDMIDNVLPLIASQNVIENLVKRYHCIENWHNKTHRIIYICVF